MCPISQGHTTAIPRIFIPLRRQPPRGYAPFREICQLEINSSRPSKAITTTDPLISATSMESITLSDHFTFQMLQQLLLQRRSLQKVTNITPTIKSIIQAVWRNRNMQIVLLFKSTWLALPVRTPRVYIYAGRWRLEGLLFFYLGEDFSKTFLWPEIFLGKKRLKIHCSLSHCNPMIGIEC